MPCIIRFSAPNCDLDAIAASLDLAIYGLYRQGQLRAAHQPERGVFMTSGFQVAASEAPFADFKQQVTDTLDFIKLNHPALRRLATAAADLADSQFLFDFGITTRMFKVGAQIDFFPPELVRLVGELGAGLMLSQYPPTEEEKSS
ncbi:hypothetical protein GO988_20555 [Hymenobacter sp. HMF4947]|uniref:Uncharacterized protein n=1 Tax=Hymenobacter ginkgonis TaxID=2682976 RepID=A0A7K1TKV6_9BACT|nr:hypothetical protein [Hymenobacter ginkgonis]MVN78731.1 hypothetical protein [Hymenobacter ginkgonis]